MRKVFAIAQTTAREALRSKVLYALLLFALVMLAASTFIGSVTIGDQVKVIKDFGLMSTTLFAVAFAVIAGASFLQKELSKKTVYNILAKPVQRWEFVTGKFLGMLTTVLLMVALMGALLSGYVALFEGRIDTLLPVAYVFIALELIVVCALTIFFSSVVVTPALSGLFAFATFAAGRLVGFLWVYLHNNDPAQPMKALLTTAYWLLPHLYSLNVANRVVYGEPVPFAHLTQSVLYAGGYSVALLVLASILFSRREFN